MAVYLYQKALTGSGKDECQIALHGDKITGIYIECMKASIKILSCSHVSNETRTPSIDQRLDLLGKLNLPLMDGTTFDLHVEEESGYANEYTVIVTTE